METVVSYQLKKVMLAIGEHSFSFEVLADLDQAIDDICKILDPDVPSNEDLCPYFGLIWPSALALCEYLSTQFSTLDGVDVHEFGCGMALPSFLCHRLGATVSASDFHPDVEYFIHRNQRLNSASFEYCQLDWTKTGIPSASLVIGSDILYEHRHYMDVARALKESAKGGARLIISDPGRSFLQKFYDKMLELGFVGTRVAITVKDQECHIMDFTLPRS